MYIGPQPALLPSKKHAKSLTKDQKRDHVFEELHIGIMHLLEGFFVLISVLLMPATFPRMQSLRVHVQVPWHRVTGHNAG